MRRRQGGGLVCRRNVAARGDEKFDGSASESGRRDRPEVPPPEEHPKEQGMELAGNLGHLVYSTLVHPGDTWDEMWASLNRYLPEVKSRVSPDKPFGVSIRISRNSADRLTSDAEERARLKAFLRASDMYLITANAFPYGPFKGERVKEQVYEPDWRTDDRAQYTAMVADILAEMAPPGIAPTPSRRAVPPFRISSRMCKCSMGHRGANLPRPSVPPSRSFYGCQAARSAGGWCLERVGSRSSTMAVWTSLRT